MRKNRGSRRSQRGAAAIEFAIVLPILLLFILGIVDLGLMMNSVSVTANAAREGARAAALGATTAQTQAVARSAFGFLPGAAAATNTVTVTCKSAAGASCSLDDSTADSGGTVEVTVSYVHSWLSPGMLGLGDTTTIVRSSEMRIEG